MNRPDMKRRRCFLKSLFLNPIRIFLPRPCIAAMMTDRRLPEPVFNRYKQDGCLDKTNVQGDFSAIGAESINFLFVVAACRIIRKATKAGISDNTTYADMADDLSGA